MPEDGRRYEVIDGRLYVTPVPPVVHQEVMGRVLAAIARYADTHDLGRVIIGPVGVRLPGQPVPLLPDIVFISKGRLDIIGEAYVEGAPDLVVEVTAADSSPFDRHEKRRVYEQAAVPEYWLLDYQKRAAEVYWLSENQYQRQPGAVIQSAALPGLAIDAATVLRPSLVWLIADAENAVEQLAEYSDQELLDIGRLSVPTAMTARFQALLDKERAAGLDTQEAQEIARIQRYAQGAMLLKGQAAALLKGRGMDTSELRGRN